MAETVRRAVVLHDDEHVLAQADGLLTAEGFDVRTTTSAFRAMELAGGFDADLVVLGLSAVDDRDLELVGLLRERWPDALLVVLFPATLRERAARALAMGADAYLPEPWYPGELVSLAARTRARMERTVEIAAVGSGAAGSDTDSTETLERLAAGVAHTVRNPLQILELMRGSVEAGEKLNTAEMGEQIQRIAQVVEELTRFAAPTQRERLPSDLHALVRTAFTPGTGARFDLSLDAAPTEISAAPEMLLTALQLLRRRAERVTPADGIVIVRTTRSDDWLELSVTDGGPAPTAEELGTFFEPSGDEAAVQAGTWLETAAIAGIVRSHGGSTDVGPGVNMGTRIRVRLPARPPDGGAAAPAP